MLLRAAKVNAWLHDRDYLIPEDIHAVFFPTVAHRVFFHPVYEMRRSQVSRALMDQIIRLSKEKLVPTGLISAHQYFELKASLLTHFLNVSYFRITYCS